MITLAADTITAAANAAGITNVSEGSETITDRLKTLPRVEYFVLNEDIDKTHAGLVAVKIADKKEYRTRKRFRRVLRVRTVIAAETEAGAEDFFKTFLKNLPKHVSDADGFDVTVTPRRADRRGFSRSLVEVFSKREISIYITFTGGIYVADEPIDLIPSVTLNPEVQ